MRETRTTCPYCGVGCGVLASRREDGAVSVRGDPEHPSNFGRLCSKGSALGETAGLEERLLHPEIAGRRASWDEALDLVAATFGRAIAEHGPDAVAIYGSGQLLTEDYYVANKLMKGFVGSANIDTNSRLCMASTVAGHRRAFGADTVPGTYEDLELADLVVLVGSNLAWCHPVLYQRLAAAKQSRPGMRVVLVDPRRTMTADIADLHLAIAPDGDVALFNGLLAHLAETDAVDRAFVAAHTTGFAGALAAAGRAAPGEVARAAGLAAGDVAAFFALFAGTERVVTVFSQGVNQSSIGTDKVNAIINCHLATGRIGRPGMGPFSVTGQPNAMGGREVGGLANMLAAHMDIEDEAARARVARFWKAPRMARKAGLKAVEMFRAVADGRIKALWIMATNPVDSLPDASAVEAALAACPFVVVSDASARTDTIRRAHIRLPAAAWGEKDGTVTNSERRISRQRAFLPPPGEVRPDWAIVCEVARRMGHGAAFAYASPGEIFAEHAALSAFENGGERDFDIGGLAGLPPGGYDALAPVQWPLPAGAAPADRRFFAEGGFYTADRKGRFVAVAGAAPARTTPDFPLVLNTGRIRDQWHTMTRTAKSPRLSQHLAEPFVEIHPDDARRCGLGEADIAEIESPHGTVLLRVLVTRRQRPRSLFVPMHWTDQFAASARIGRLAPPETDPVSGQPALKHVAVRARRFPAAAFGFAVLAERPEGLDTDYWALARCAGGWRCEFAMAGARDWAAFATRLLGGDAGMLTYLDRAGGRARFARFEGERLLGAIFVAPGPVAVSREWAAEQLAASHPDRSARLLVLSGRPGAGGADRGPTVCVCFGIGANQIAAAGRAGHRSVKAIGEALQAGTNCGSCRAEIAAILAGLVPEAAE